MAAFGKLIEAEIDIMCVDMCTGYAELIRDRETQLNTFAPLVLRIFEMDCQRFARDEIILRSAMFVGCKYILDPQCTIPFTVLIVFKASRGTLMDIIQVVSHSVLDASIKGHLPTR